MISGYLIPGILIVLCSAALRKKQDCYSVLLSGGAEGLKLLVLLLPTWVFLLTSVSMLQASGASEVLSRILAPILTKLGVPPECALLILIRPISGSAALAVGAEIMSRYGVDSTIGKTAAVMLGASETTFYTISVYFGGTGIRKTRYTLPAALLADMSAFLAAAWVTPLF